MQQFPLNQKTVELSFMGDPKMKPWCDHPVVAGTTQAVFSNGVQKRHL